MECPQQSLRVSQIDKTTFGVVGCGRKSVYVLVPTLGGAKWLLNNTTAVTSRR
jgi:hypothetical protein